MPIPIETAQWIAESEGYDQIVIIGRLVDKPGQPGHEHVTTFGQSPDDKKVAAQMGQYLKHKVMGWPECRHEHTEALTGSGGRAKCLDCGCLMPDEMNFWEFPDSEARWPK